MTDILAGVKRDLEAKFLEDNPIEHPNRHRRLPTASARTFAGLDVAIGPSFSAFTFISSPFLTKQERYRYGVEVRFTTFWERWFTKPWNPRRKLHKEPIYRYKTVPMLDDVYVMGNKIVGHPAAIESIKVACGNRYGGRSDERIS